MLAAPGAQAHRETVRSVRLALERGFPSIARNALDAADDAKHDAAHSDIRSLLSIVRLPPCMVAVAQSSWRSTARGRRWGRGVRAAERGRVPPSSQAACAARV